jgi:outer membrane protein TolC
MAKQISLVILFINLFFAVQAQQKDLNFYIKMGLQNSPLLKDFQNQIQINRIDSMRIRAGLGPQVAAVSNNMVAPLIKGWGFDEIITNGTNVSALLTVSKEISGAKNKQNRYEAFSLQNQSILNSGKISEQELKKTITSQYITAFGDWQQFNFNSEVLFILAKEQKILKVLTEKGVYKQTDFLSFAIRVQQQEILVEQLKSRYLDNYTMLNYLCGLEDTSFTALPDPELITENLTGYSNTVFFYQFVVDSLKLQNADKQIDFSYKPRISLIADGGYYSSLAYRPGKNFGMDIGITFSVPIYDGNQRKMQHNRIVLEEQTRKYYQDYFSSQYRQQLRRLYQQLEVNQKLVPKIRNQISFAQTLMEANHKLMEASDIHISDYILSISNYINAKNMMVENTLLQYQIINELNYWNRSK